MDRLFDTKHISAYEIRSWEPFALKERKQGLDGYFHKRAEFFSVMERFKSLEVMPLQAEFTYFDISIYYKSKKDQKSIQL